MTNVSDLITRVEGLDKPDREVDGLLFGWLHGTEPCGTFMLYFDEEKFQFRHPTKDRGAWYVRGENVPEFTGSIDAVVALIEMKLPGAEIELTNLYGVARATLPLNGDYETGSNECGLLACALLAAFLRAYERTLSNTGERRDG